MHLVFLLPALYYFSSVPVVLGTPVETAKNVQLARLGVEVSHGVKDINMSCDDCHLSCIACAASLIFAGICALE
jgi:hypothetical protein